MVRIDEVAVQFKVNALGGSQETWEFVLVLVMVLKLTKDGVHYEVQNLLVREDAQERSFCDNRSMPTLFLQNFWWFLAGIMHGCPRFHFKVLFFPRIRISYSTIS